jgi:PBSX family phage terminase large subunit
VIYDRRDGNLEYTPEEMLDLFMFPKQVWSCQSATARINLWHGAVSSGKTYASIWKWLSWIVNEAPKHGAFLMCGKTERTLQHNIIDEIVNMVGENRFTTTWSRGQAEFMGRTIYLVSGPDERSQERIRGLSLAGAYCDELTLIPESFFTMLLSRLRIRGARLFATTNPDSPFHWLKVNFIDRKEELNFRDFKFELDDNTTLDPEYVANIKTEYTGLWYRRFILGEWCQAEGAIYDMFRQEVHIISPDSAEKYFDKVIVSIDYGTANPFVALVMGVKYTRPSAGREETVTVTVLDEFYYSSVAHLRQMTDGEYCQALMEFIEPYAPHYIVIDPSAASFKVECQRNNLNVVDAINDVLDGIRIVANALTNEVLQICETCPNLIAEIPNYVWDKKAQMNGLDRPVKVNDHACDALRYACMDVLGKPHQMIKTGGLTLTHSLFEEAKHREQEPTYYSKLTRRMA